MHHSIFSRRSIQFLSLCIVALLFSTDGEAALPKVKKGWLGVGIREMTPSLVQEYELGKRTGLLVTSVVPDSPADEAGINEDDVILKYDGKKVELTEDFTKMVQKTAPKTTVKLVLFRDGKEKSLEVTLGKRRSKRHALSFVDEDVFFVGRPRLGVEVQELDADLAPYFDLKAGSGVLVLKVVEDSPAEKAGLKSGDVIVSVDEETVTAPEELVAGLADYEDEEVAKIGYVRKGKKAQVEVKLEGSGKKMWIHKSDNLGHEIEQELELLHEEGGHRLNIRKGPRVKIKKIIEKGNII